MVSVLRRRAWQCSLLVFALTRVAIVWGRPLQRFPDTVGYESLNFFGSNDRFWPISLVYWIVRNDTWRVIVQCGAQIASFGFLATVIVAVTRKRLWTGLPILLFACSPQIARFDLAILSESLGLTYLAFLVGALILWLHHRTVATTSTTIIAVALFGMTRSPHQLVLVCATLVALIFTLRVGTQRAAITAMVMVALTGWGFVQLHNNRPMSTLVFYTVLEDRVIHYPEVAVWFSAHGMPFNSDIAQSTGYVYPTDLAPEVLKYLELPRGQMPPKLMKVGGMEFARWATAHGWRTYAHYVVTHPHDSLTVAKDRLDYMLNPTDDLLLPLMPRAVVPRGVFGDFRWWLAGAALALVATAIRRLWSLTQTWIVGSLIVCALWFATIAHTSGTEHGRHAITVAVAIRLLSLLAILFSADALTRDGNYRRSDG